MLEELLPPQLYKIIKELNYKYLTEIRIRVGQPIIVSIKGINYYLTQFGVSNSKQNSITANKMHCEYIIRKLSDNSLYTINDQMINGYITYKGGVRVGVAGEFVYIDNKIKTIKNINSLNIRVPHEVDNCSINVLRYIKNDECVYNTLILSPAGCGKTTFVRDLVKQISLNSDLLNILVVDERSEITGVYDGEIAFKNMRVDVLSNCTKSYAFDNGIRSLRPDVIITDEIAQKDIDCIENAMTCGVKVVATIHASNVQDLKNKPCFNRLLNNKLFDRFVVLSGTNGPGSIVGVYNENLECIAL